MEAFDASLLHGIRPMKVDGKHLKWPEDTKESTGLYTEKKPEEETLTLKAIPYYAWANREKKDMRVWMIEG